MAKSQTGNLLKFKFVKKTSMSYPIKSLQYIKYYGLSGTRHSKHPGNSISHKFKKICT